MAHNRLLFTFYMAASMAVTQVFAQEDFIQGYAPRNPETPGALEGIDEALDLRLQIGMPASIPEKWLEPAWELDWVHAYLGKDGVVTPKAPREPHKVDRDDRSFEEITADLFARTFAQLDYKSGPDLLPQPVPVGAISILELRLDPAAPQTSWTAVTIITGEDGTPDLQAMFETARAAYQAEARTAGIKLPRPRPVIEDADIRLAKIYTALAINIVPLKTLPAELVSQQMNIAWLENNTPGTPATRMAQFTLQNPGLAPIP